MTVSWTQRVFVLAAAVFAVGASFLQATGALGLTPAEFASSGDSTVRAASYAFAIWGVIYAGLLLYAIYQLIPVWASDEVLRRFGWPSGMSMLAIGFWLVAAGADWRWATVALIAFAAAILIFPLTSRSIHSQHRRDQLFILLPLALLAGWLTIATALNTITALTAQGLVAEQSATAWALAGIAATIAVTALVYVRSKNIAYPLPVIWGLIAVYVAESGRRPEAAWAALLGAVFLLGVIAWRTFTLRRVDQRLKFRREE